MKNIMFKIVTILCLTSAFLFAAVDFNSASKEELLKIKGIGDKKAENIIAYRKTNKINNIDDLRNIKGFGDKLISKIKLNTK